MNRNSIPGNVINLISKFSLFLQWFNPGTNQSPIFLAQDHGSGWDWLVIFGHSFQSFEQLNNPSWFTMTTSSVTYNLDLSELLKHQIRETFKLIYSSIFYFDKSSSILKEGIKGCHLYQTKKKKRLPQNRRPAMHVNWINHTKELAESHVTPSSIVNKLATMK